MLHLRIKHTRTEIHDLLGERLRAADNNKLGAFKIEGIPPAPKGEDTIVVSFDLDANSKDANIQSFVKIIQSDNVIKQGFLLVKKINTLTYQVDKQ